MFDKRSNMPLIQRRIGFILLVGLTCSLVMPLACDQAIADNEANRALCGEYRQVVDSFAARNRSLPADVSDSSIRSLGASTIIAAADFTDISLEDHSEADARLLDSLEGFQNLLLARMIRDAELSIILDDIVVAGMTEAERNQYGYEQPQYGKGVPELCQSAGLPTSATNIE